MNYLLYDIAFFMYNFSKILLQIMFINLDLGWVVYLWMGKLRFV